MILSLTNEEIGKKYPKQMIKRIELLASYKPDFICPPERFVARRKIPHLKIT
jgi:hypothetical protein